MRFLFKFSVIGIVCSLMFFSVKGFASENAEKDFTAIYVISNVKSNAYFGNRSQALGIKNALLGMLEKQDYAVSGHEVDVYDLEFLKKQIRKNDKKCIVISSGDYGIRAISQLKEDKEISSKILTIWSGHQEFSNLQEFLSSINIVVIPKYAISNDLARAIKSADSLLVEVDFVPHNLNLKKLKLAYNKFKYKDEIPLNRAYTVLLFGGDAPDASGRMLNMHDREIHKIAKKVSEIVKQNNSTLVISNNFRTKKAQLALFFNNIAANGVKDYVFFDFHKKGKVYNPLLYLISQGNVAIVTGDSVSMMDESMQFSKKPVYIAISSSMNENHKNHLNFMREKKYAMLLDEYQEDNFDYKIPSFATKVIVKEITDKVLEFLAK